MLANSPAAAGADPVGIDQLRFPEQDKDVVVIAGDGGLIDIGFQGLMHSWFRHEKFTTIMLDNEVYGNTGGQESGMTEKGKMISSKINGNCSRHQRHLAKAIKRARQIALLPFQV